VRRVANCYTPFTLLYFTLHRQSKEASIIWSQHEKTRKFPGERDNARNNARCTKARKATHGLDGQHQDVDRTPVEESIRMTEDADIEEVRQWCGQPPTLGSRTAKEQKLGHIAASSRWGGLRPNCCGCLSSVVFTSGTRLRCAKTD